MLSETGEPSNSTPRRKNGSLATQFQVFPPATRKCPGRPTNPSSENPHMTCTMAAIATTKSEASRACAALRDLPSPVLISAKPALARGTRNIRRRQKAAEVWEKPGSVTLVPHRGRDEPEPPEPDPIARRRFPPAQMRFATEPNGGAPSWTGRSPIRPKGAENPQASCDSVKSGNGLKICLSSETIQYGT